MGCILTKVCLEEELLMQSNGADEEAPPRARRLSRGKTTLLALGDPATSVSAATDVVIPSVPKRDVAGDKKDAEGGHASLVYGGGVPGVALDADRVELPEFTGIREGGYQSLSGRLRWGTRTRAGNDPLRRRKENQDSFCVCDGLANDKNATFFSVFDGHGPEGAFVSHFVREKYHSVLADAYTALIRGTPSPGAAGALTRRASVTCDLVAEMFQQAARSMVDSLAASRIDISVSGTTAVGMLVREKDVFLANVGDSRAVIARYCDEEQRYVLHCETKDHKPDVPEECARIERNNGRVFEWGSYRVWLQDVDMPGLAMSRSFGDAVAKTVGVTAEPEVLTVERLNFSSGKENGGRPAAFAVLASDGIWEFMTTDECIDFVAKCIVESGMQPQEACTALVDAACDLWNAEEDVVDDITATLVYF